MKCQRCKAKKTNVKTYRTTSGRELSLCRECLNVLYATQPAPGDANGFIIDLEASA